MTVEVTPFSASKGRFCNHGFCQHGDFHLVHEAESARPSVFAALTQREFEIVNLMAQRLSNREIAEGLFLSEGSVKQYANQIYSKLHIEGDTRTKRKQLAKLILQKP